MPDCWVAIRDVVQPAGLVNSLTTEDTKDTEDVRPGPALTERASLGDEVFGGLGNYSELLHPRGGGRQEDDSGCFAFERLRAIGSSRRPVRRAGADRIWAHGTRDVLPHRSLTHQQAPRRSLHARESTCTTGPIRARSRIPRHPRPASVLSCHRHSSGTRQRPAARQHASMGPTQPTRVRAGG